MSDVMFALKLVSVLTLSLTSMIFLLLGVMSLWVCIWDQFRSLKLMTAGYFTGAISFITIIVMIVK